MKTLDEAANCIEAASTPQSAAYKTRVAQDLRRGQLDLQGLSQIERDARRQLQAVTLARRLLTEAVSGPDRAGVSGHMTEWPR